MGRPYRTEDLRAQLEDRILNRPAEGEYGAIESGVITAAGQVLLSMDGDSHIHLLMPVPADAVITEDRRSEGVQLVRHELTEGRLRRVYADLVCTKPHLRGTFHMLADEVLERVGSGTQRADAAATGVIARWRELLDRPAQPPLGTERLAGLFGELLVLRELAAVCAHPLLAWTGPLGQRHDFTSSGMDVEVKASLGQGSSVIISGWEQLLPHDGGLLYLRHLRLEEAHGEPSVPDLVEELCRLGVDRPALLSVLGRIGYDIEHGAEYRRRCFRLLSQDLYRVDAGFPRLVPESFAGGRLPEGISAIRYTVSLDAARHCLVPPSAWPDVLAKVATAGR